MKEQSSKTVGTRQKDQWVPHNSPRVKLKQRMLLEWRSKNYDGITSLGSLDLWVGRKGKCLGYKFGPYVKECPNGKEQVIKDTIDSSRKQGTPRMEVEGFKVAFVNGKVHV